MLRESEERYRVLAEKSARQARIYETTLSSTVDLLYVFSLEGRFIYTNDRLPVILGKSAEEVLGKNFHDLEYPPELAARLQRQIEQVIETRQPLRDETPYTGVAGTRSYEYIFAPVFAAEGSVDAVAGVTRDITERREAQQALERQAVSLREADRPQGRVLGHARPRTAQPAFVGRQRHCLAEGNAEFPRTRPGPRMSSNARQAS